MIDYTTHLIICSVLLRKLYISSYSPVPPLGRWHSCSLDPWPIETSDGGAHLQCFWFCHQEPELPWSALNGRQCQSEFYLNVPVNYCKKTKHRTLQQLCQIHTWQFFEAIDDLQSSLLHWKPVFTHHQAKHDQRHKLTSVGLQMIVRHTQLICNLLYKINK